MKSKTEKKLVLSKQTVARLNNHMMRDVNGGNLSAVLGPDCPSVEACPVVTVDERTCVTCETCVTCLTCTCPPYTKNCTS